jgi:spore photoproduct lyase
LRVPRFERIYVERIAADHPQTRRILLSYPEAPVVTVEHYGEVFHRRHQEFQLQKRNPALVLAVARGRLLYQATSRIADDSSVATFYTDQLRNCPFNCDYCFLQGMHQSGYPLVFVNTEDYLAAAHAQSLEGAFYLTVSFLTDALAYEPLIPTVAAWVGFANEHSSVTIEVRTKSDHVALLPNAPSPNVILTWTLSPRRVTNRYERGTATLSERLTAMGRAAERGWRVRAAIDPIVLIPEWREAYGELIDQIVSIEPGLVEGVSYGVFRMNDDFLDAIQRARGDSPILHHPFDRSDSLATYTASEIDAIRDFFEPRLVDRFGAENVSFVHG